MTDVMHMTDEQLREYVARLEKRNAQLETAQAKRVNLTFKVSEKGAVSVYGNGRWPVTQYYEQWVRLLNAADDLRAFLEANKERLKMKGDDAPPQS